MLPVEHIFWETGAPAEATSEKRFCALMPVFSIERVVSEDTPS